MLIKRIIVAILSTIIFSIVLAYMMGAPVLDWHQNSWYAPLNAWIPFLLLITGIPYLLGGVTASLLIDKYIDKEIIKFPFYLIAGFIVGVITVIITFGTISISIEMLLLGIFGTAGSLIFFVLMLLSKAFGKTV